MNEDSHDDFDDLPLHFEVVKIAFSTPEVFAEPDDPAVDRIQKHVAGRIEALEESEVYFRTVHSGFEDPAQHPLEGGRLIQLARDFDQAHLQLSLFSEHPEIVVNLEPMELRSSVRELLGAIVIEETDMRENVLVAAAIGLMRRAGEPVEHIVDLAISAFDAILDIAVALRCPLWEAHERYLRIAFDG